ncbi:uncharacterized protein LOC132302742 isoform X2 [Cornus florida]|uniref:uncharacterized protein LOC132302742 isoform X2 n=1 Tax=Cornus florida TaxID=4283 RepID=UPI0028975CA0|nr:uncharacterized protein LOC132302742 isoform X2 [Cornus florida]XP_059655652.1 uncharacterized protein LOC132302742 isoform X2 [Cornus florida]XP_059655653.1 uncharacterized protein LOC132302742 isoform X2 [Cornus florida]XP_059655654.1 uncharacterized protein LOC132302742 isoform X2 [Cornus florida]XP_059655655.1 uncharacterized protein LOC132302742 isoform X2 [Cornus florida]
MNASQLLRVLQSLPTHVNHEACNSANDTAGPKATMKENHNVILCDQKDCERDEDLLASDTAGSKTTMKENQNGTLCDLKDCERDADLLASEMNDKDEFWNSPDIDSSMVVGDHTKVDKDDVKDSVTPCTIPSGKIELLEETYFYTDKNVMECELPELIVCYKESTYHVVKDICIDEGVPSEKRILIESSKDDRMVGSIFLPSNVEENGDIIKERVDTELQIPDGFKSSSEKDCDENTANDSRTKEKVDNELHIPDGLKSESESKDDNKYPTRNSTHTGETNCCTTDSREKYVADGMLLVQEFSNQKSLESLSKSSDHHGDEVEQLTCQIPCAEVTSGSPAAVSAAEEPNSSKAETAATSDFNSSTTAASSRDKIPENEDHRQPCESQNVPNHEDGFSDSLLVVNQFQYADGESSFSAAVPLSGLLTYSGHIAYSGNISLRSDSSTTSTRSFAFPVLQSEWNSSPVRMAKADRRQLRKHRGWRQGLLCCRF